MTKHNKMSSSKKLIIVLLSIILVCSLVLIIRIKIDEYLNNQKQIEISQVIDTIDIPDIDITPKKTERMLQIAELQKENSEVVGWLEIEGTNISYPVCQADNNDYYLTHSYKKEKVDTTAYSKGFLKGSCIIVACLILGFFLAYIMIRKIP